MAPTPAHLPQDEYDRIVDRMVIACVDLIPVYKGTFLLSLRKNEPAKGLWYPIGGRIYKGERLQEAAARKLKEEIGVELSPSKFRFCAADETIFHGKGTDQNRHSVNIVYVVELENLPTEHLDTAQLDEVRWFDAVDPTWDPYVRRVLSAAGYTT